MEERKKGEGRKEDKKKETLPVPNMFLWLQTMSPYAEKCLKDSTSPHNQSSGNKIVYPPPTRNTMLISSFADCSHTKVSLTNI